MKYKVGDKVRIKSLDWYNENKDENGSIYCGGGIMLNPYNAEGFCGRILTIKAVNSDFYTVVEDRSYWNDYMIEGLVEEDISLDKAGQITDFEYEGLAYNLPDGYIFKDENGNVINATKIVLEKKKEYPKTYEECLNVLSFVQPEFTIDVLNEHYERLLSSFYKLLICRDAYWKIAGEEMGLGKPWELSIGTPIYYIYYNRTVGTIKNDYADDIQGNIILAFPTEEMRDAFKDNFDTDIEICKEFL